MRRLIVILIVGFWVSESSAQQLGHYNQYAQNPFVLNPASAGIYPWADVSLGFRRQWVGIDNSPRTFYAAGHSVIKRSKVPFNGNPSIRSSYMTGKEPQFVPYQASKTKVAVGGIVISDQAGMFNRTSAGASGAFHIPVAESTFLSAGLMVGVANYAFDQSLAVLSNPNDDTYNKFIGQGTSFTYLDGAMGLWFYAPQYYVGYSATQITQNFVPLGDGFTNNEQNVHHFMTAGYAFAASDKTNLKPSVMVKLMEPAPLSFDATLIAELGGLVWTGLSYRHGDAAVVMAGMNIRDFMRFGYSFEYTTSELQNFNSGGHELFLGIMFAK